MDTTTLVLPAHVADVDAFGNLLDSPGGLSRHDSPHR
jgi:hypothetical protein